MEKKPFENYPHFETGELLIIAIDTRRIHKHKKGRRYFCLNWLVSKVLYMRERGKAEGLPIADDDAGDGEVQSKKKNSEKNYPKTVKPYNELKINALGKLFSTVFNTQLEFITVFTSNVAFSVSPSSFNLNDNNTLTPTVYEASTIGQFYKLDQNAEHTPSNEKETSIVDSEKP
ncbi:CLUMA_CG000268, isoform A [Clunio marinus]|uniref:CLUMA_CG000268, isoform A n=1 Tax=Clunio marinus TaxID=568069 RepID=A0A1J1HJ62_9DIPT|nr:CLUMA_CG000268, isoform A [Clunio marinus]